MEAIFTQRITVSEKDCNRQGFIKLSALLHEAQEISGRHCEQLGYDWNTMASREYFWAVLRHKIYIHSLPRAGQTVTLETWPMPTTRSAYPRAVRALDEKDNVLFDVVSLWVIMNTKTRAMVLPGKSGVEVEGFLRGDEPAGPGSLAPGKHENSRLWQVSQEDLDINGHVNNAKYLDHVEELTGDVKPKEVTVCYLAEVLPRQEIFLQWAKAEDGSLTVDGYRRKTDVRDENERVFAAKMSC